MFCPECGAEFRAGFTECSDCRVPLVQSAPASARQVGQPDLRCVTVFESADPAIIALARSILESAEINFETSGESLQDLFGFGRLPGVANIVAGPVQFKVEEKDAGEAASLLQELKPIEHGSDAPDEPTPESLLVETRHEVPSDYETVREIHRRAFGRDTEATLVDLLRNENHVEIAMVAVVDNDVVGHVMFSPIKVTDSFKGFRGLGLGPVAIRPEFQNNGIGSKLIRDSLKQCRAAGYDAVVALGNPAYYKRFGFSRASDYGLSNEYEAIDEFMVMELRPDVLVRLEGLVKYAPEFASVE